MRQSYVDIIGKGGAHENTLFSPSCSGVKSLPAPIAIGYAVVSHRYALRQAISRTYIPIAFPWARKIRR